jgi:hypothetical protein
LPSQFDEALRIPRSMGPTFGRREAGFAQGEFDQKTPQTGVTELINLHIKWGRSASNLAPGQLGS